MEHSSKAPVTSTIRLLEISVLSFMPVSACLNYTLYSQHEVKCVYARLRISIITCL